ncbi:MAG: HU family DNA-binding protein [Alphaproteobacteria bacterium]|nr:HU family DNA-binding protein [Alphaproteobacteria bacterium]
MKLKELNEAIAQTCDVRATVVNAVQNETFRQLRAALDKGEKVIVPDFGIFMVKEVQGESGAKKIVRFRERTGGEGKKDKEGRKKKGPGLAAAKTGDDGDA